MNCDRFAERNFEDHDCLVENMVFWPRDSDNKIVFSERTDKYDVFFRPEVGVKQLSQILSWLYDL
jgi:amyloid beta A4 precursor protein-binding family B protein 1-interacting protein